MAKLKSIIGICHECGNNIEHNYIERCEVSFFNKHVKKEILAKKENYFVATCSKCGTEVVMGYSFRFVDPNQKYGILLVRNGDPLENRIINSARSNDVKNGYQTRFVADGTELAEKIQIFDAGMDDRTIEMCKILLWDDLCEQDPQYGEFALRSCNYFRHPKDGSAYSDAHLMCYAYDAGEERDTVILQLDESYYQNIAEHLRPDFSAHPLGKFEEINKNWAYKIVDYRKNRLNL